MSFPIAKTPSQSAVTALFEHVLQHRAEDEEEGSDNERLSPVLPTRVPPQPARLQTQAGTNQQVLGIDPTVLPFLQYQR